MAQYSISFNILRCRVGRIWFPYSRYAGLIHRTGSSDVKFCHFRVGRDSISVHSLMKKRQTCHRPATTFCGICPSLSVFLALPGHVQQWWCPWLGGRVAGLWRYSDPMRPSTALLKTMQASTANWKQSGQTVSNYGWRQVAFLKRYQNGKAAEDAQLLQGWRPAAPGLTPSCSRVDSHLLHGWLPPPPRLIE